MCLTCHEPAWSLASATIPGALPPYEKSVGKASVCKPEIDVFQENIRGWRRGSGVAVGESNWESQKGGTYVCPLGWTQPMVVGWSCHREAEKYQSADGAVFSSWPGQKLVMSHRTLTENAVALTARFP